MVILAQGLVCGATAVAAVICAAIVIWAEFAYGDSLLELIVVGLGVVALVAGVICLAYCCWGFIGVFLQTR